MSRPFTVALVGRPNVGKSALFNCIAEKKIAIVDSAEGVTRDRLLAPAHFFNRSFIIMDTGGIDPRSKATFNKEVLAQAMLAVEEADALVMVVDGQVGSTLLDKEVAELLLKSGKPLTLAVNKLDAISHDALMHQFHSLGISSMVAVSAAQGRHMAELLESALSTLPEETSADFFAPQLKIAIVGRPNVGKSTLINTFLNEERCIVSPIAGTTRDSIDLPCTIDGQECLLIDTAGIRRKHKENDVIEKFSAIRTQRAIERCDICLFLIDANEGLTTQEKLIASQIEEAGKGCLLFFNKWDMIKGFRMEHCLTAIEQDASFLSHCPKVFGSALTGRNVDKLFPLLFEIHAASKRKISTGQLNKCVERALQKNHPAMLQGKRLRIYYLVQTETAPPSFTLFVNNAELMQNSYRKYLIHQLREQFGFAGLPIRFSLRSKMKKEAVKELGNSLPSRSPQPEDEDEEEFSE